MRIPFNPFTRIEFVLDEPMVVELSIFNVADQKIAVIADKRYAAGNHSLIWSPDNRSSSAVDYAVLKTNSGEFPTIRFIRG